ncbi:MAG: hypothetical protein JW751_15775 [Polyangiaceae bacterium]|nr:hypothetical protein [Polyangiaceae bacterium]
MTVEIREIPLGGGLRDFLDVVDYIYRDDPNYVRPLNMDVQGTLSPKNPFFLHGEGTIFTAYRNDWCVGRCTAQIDRLHLARYQDKSGFFGFLDTIDDEEVATALLDAAAEWLAVRGMARMRGPLMLSMNGEVGCLVEGFDSPPVIMMPHHRPYQGELIEKAGLAKLKDCYAWKYKVGEVPPRARKAHDEIAAMPEVKTRHADPKHLERDVRLVIGVHNDGWSENWGFVPMTEEELAKMAKELKLILDPELTFITEIDGEAAAVALALPNINEVIRDINGKLFPIGLPKILWRLSFDRPKWARLIILGIRKKYRGAKKYAALSTYLYAQMNQAGLRRGYEYGELSYTLDDNHPVNTAIKFMGGKIYKRYRFYERTL